MAPIDQHEAPGPALGGSTDPQREAPVVDTHFITLLIAAAADRDGPMLASLLLELHPTDIADALKNLPEHTLEILAHLIGKRLPPAALLELPDEKRAELLALLPADAA